MLALDTHVVVWIMADPSQLSKLAKQAIDDAREQSGGIFISDATMFELANLISRKRLGLHVSMESFLEEVESHFTIRQSIVTLPRAPFSCRALIHEIQWTGL